MSALRSTGPFAALSELSSSSSSGAPRLTWAGGAGAMGALRRVGCWHVNGGNEGGVGNCSAGVGCSGIGRVAGLLGDGGQCPRFRGDADAVRVRAIIIYGPTPDGAPRTSDRRACAGGKRANRRKQLFRHRNSCFYADLPVMPTWRVGGAGFPCLGAGWGGEVVGITVSESRNARSVSGGWYLPGGVPIGAGPVDRFLFEGRS
jgi:hypothetical protein